MLVEPHKDILGKKSFPAVSECFCTVVMGMDMEGEEQETEIDTCRLLECSHGESLGSLSLLVISCLFF